MTPCKIVVSLCAAFTLVAAAQAARAQQPADGPQAAPMATADEAGGSQDR